MPSLELDALTKTWPELTIRASLTVPDSSLLVIAGPSGCGKSTLLRMTAGLLDADGGRVLVGGSDVSGRSPKERGIGMVFQDAALFPHLDAGGNVAYGLWGRGRSKRERLAEADRLLASVGLEGFGRRRIDSLSGGERQRVALARTLAVQPGIVLFDEPLSSLDPALRKRLRQDIRDEQRRFGLTAVYVTHDLEEALAVADKLAVMDAGAILQCGAPSELWERPDSAGLARFLGSGPCLPIVGHESGRVLTADGNFPLASASAPEGMPLADGAYVFFGRGDAVISDAPAVAGSGCFTARCLRADYAGDSVDCLMQSGDTLCTLRFPAARSPKPGSSARYAVPAENIRLLPKDDADLQSR